MGRKIKKFSDQRAVLCAGCKNISFQGWGDRQPRCDEEYHVKKIALKKGLCSASFDCASVSNSKAQGVTFGELFDLLEVK